MDYFSFLGLSRKLNIDIADLDERYRAMSRRSHPDYFYNAPPAERRASLERSSYLNDAYRTLRNRASRIEYLLKLEGVTSSSDGATRGIPPALLEEVFALNEELDDIRGERSRGAPEIAWKGRLQCARAPIARKRAEHEADLEALSAKWDALVDTAAGEAERRRVLDGLQERFLERNYINNLLSGLERELES